MYHNIHPFIPYQRSSWTSGSQWVPEPIPAVLGLKEGLHRVQVATLSRGCIDTNGHPHSRSHSHLQPILKLPVTLMWMGCRKKQEFLESPRRHREGKTHTIERRTCLLLVDCTDWSGVKTTNKTSIVHGNTQCGQVIIKLLDISGTPGPNCTNTSIVAVTSQVVLYY